MAQHSDPIAGYTVGSNPIGSGWTQRNGTAPNSSSVESGTTPVGDRYWRVTEPDAGSINWYSWDGPGNADATLEVLLILRRNGADQIGGCARIQASGDCYWGGLRNNDLDTRVASMVSGGQTSLATGAHGITSPTNKWIGVRLQTTSTTIRARSWDYEAESEPSTWDASATDSTISGAGYVGFFNWTLAGSTFDLAYISAGTAGDAAPDPAASGVTGAGALTLPLLTASAAGTVDVQGTATPDLPLLTISAAGSVAIDGAGALTLPLLTISAAGTVGDAVTGDGALTLPLLEASATGAVAITGTAALTLPTLTTTADGDVAVQGAGALTLPLLTVEASGGAPAITGTANLTLPSLTVTAAGSVDVQGAATVTLPALTLSAAGTVPVTGSAALTLPLLVLDATGAISVQGTGALTLPLLTLTGQGGAAAAVAVPPYRAVLTIVNPTAALSVVDRTPALSIVNPTPLLTLEDA